MATSGDTTYRLAANEIIAEAFDICGVGSEGESINADMYQRAMRSLNLLAKAWSAEGHLWKQVSRSVTLVAGQDDYTLTPKPLRVIEVRRRVTSSGIDTPLNDLARQDYLEQPNKASQATPISFYYDPRSTAGTLYLWPTASTAVAAAMTLELTEIRPIEDFDSTADDADFPNEWMQALSYGLAEQLALKYGVTPDIRSEISARAGLYKAQLEAWDTEPASLFLQPEARWC
ncbi:hypothetical protein [Rhizorhapis sp.]|uniref:phage adaptor protein n=1 Tax=Rhizorhapis sp. TaxID=1968842 RepID=UPI002B467AAD|nr:hypothetical protein [Rhizorhapis sp.]HKR17722.1 hypothetical protein [Rhizorhapis sp.]